MPHARFPDQGHTSGQNVRAHLHLGGWLVRALGSNTSLVYCLVHVDLKGSIPAFLTGEVNKKQPLIIDGLRALFGRQHNSN